MHNASFVPFGLFAAKTDLSVLSNSVTVNRAARGVTCGTCGTTVDRRQSQPGEMNNDRDSETPLLRTFRSELNSGAALQ